MPAIYHPRRPRASPLWQIVTAAWDTFVATYEKVHRAAMGPLRANGRGWRVSRQSVHGASRPVNSKATSLPFLRLRCPDCGEEHLLAFIPRLRDRHFCPACHQRRVRHISAWIASSVCHEVPHRQFVFTIPRVLRGIFRKRRDLLHILFQTATDTLRDSFRARLDLPDGRIGAIAAVHIPRLRDDFLFFHPHLHPATAGPPTAFSLPTVASIPQARDLPKATPGWSNSSATASFTPCAKTNSSAPASSPISYPGSTAASMWTAANAPCPPTTPTAANGSPNTSSAPLSPFRKSPGNPKHKP